MDAISNMTPIGAMMIIALTLVELVKMLVTRMTKKPAGCGGLSQKEHDSLLGTYRIVSKLDNDGVPMVYTKRSYENTQERILDAIRRTNETHIKLLAAVERFEKKASIMPGPRGRKS